jgi:sister-chromatid-cohesion protein PDS5
MDESQDWYEEDEVPPDLKARMFCLKVFRNRCLANAASQEALDISRPTIKLLTSALGKDDAFSAGDGDEYERSAHLV